MAAEFNIPASRYVEALKRNRVDTVVTVPDWMQLALHSRLAEGRDGIRSVFSCGEDQAVVVAAGLRIGGKNPVILVQNQGLHACVNATRAVGIDAGIPLVFLVGQFGREFRNFGADQQQSRAKIVRLVEPLAAVVGITCLLLEREADLARIDEAIGQSLHTKRPLALIVGAPIGWS